MCVLIYYCLSQHHTLSYCSPSFFQSALLRVLDAGLDLVCLVVTMLLVSLSLMLLAICMHQVNQRTTTIEIAERANKHFLLELVSSLVWETRHWANKMNLLSTLSHTIGAKTQLICLTDA
jgi:hypothetical protein